MDTKLRVGTDKEYRSISAALRAAREGATINIGTGIYKERLLINKSVTIAADWESQEGSIFVEWATSNPYESVVESTASSCVIEGINFRHSSPSVANNYAILNKGGELRLQDCDVTSSTGTGLASEGGEIEFFGGSIHDCKGNGAAFFASLEGKPCKAHLAGASIARNGLQGILAREDSEVLVDNCDIVGNKEYGILAKDSEVEIIASKLAGNGKGNLKQ